MRCDEVDRLLDAGGPVPEAARVHAAVCPRCAASMEAADALERILREPPPAPPAAFTDAVMARVLAEERAPAGVPSVRRAAGWLPALAAEPYAAVALALAPVAVVLGIVWPETLARLAEAARSGLAAGWGSAASSLVPTVPGSIGAMGGTAQIALAATLAAALFAAAFAAPLWIAERMAGAMAAPEAPTRPRAIPSRGESDTP